MLDVNTGHEKDISRSVFSLSRELRADLLNNRHFLTKFLSHHGRFPEQYRTIIWRCLLRLPENREIFQKLSEQPTHKELHDFRAFFPIKYGRTSAVLEKTLSTLMYWSDVLSHWDGLPAFCFPFVKHLQKEPMTCFEILLTLMRNWAFSWFEFFPNPPLGVLTFVDSLLHQIDPELLSHFKRHGIGSHIYTWLLLRTHFSDVLGGEDWCVMWDHAFVHRPCWLYCFTASFLHHHRLSLLSIHLLQDMKYYLTNLQPTLMHKVLKDTQSLYDKISADPSCTEASLEMQPLDEGFYFVFNAYPEKISNFQKRVATKLDDFEEHHYPTRVTEATVKDTINYLREQHIQDGPRSDQRSGLEPGMRASKLHGAPSSVKRVGLGISVLRSLSLFVYRILV